MFEDNFIQSLPEGNLPKLMSMVEWCLKHLPPNVETRPTHSKLLQAFVAVRVVARRCDLEVAEPEISKDATDDYAAIVQWFSVLAKAAHSKETNEQLDQIIADSEAKYEALLGEEFSYEFDDDELEKVQNLVNELRSAIQKSDAFEDKHKQRILRRLEALQREMHKKMTNLDKLWGLVADAGVMLGKFGENVKPLVDRIRELATVTWNVQARAEKVPHTTGIPFLKIHEEDEE